MRDKIIRVIVDSLVASLLVYSCGLFFIALYFNDMQEAVMSAFATAFILFTISLIYTTEKLEEKIEEWESRATLGLRPKN